jgi:hypothetical protein
MREERDMAEDRDLLSEAGEEERGVLDTDVEGMLDEEPGDFVAHILDKGDEGLLDTDPEDRNLLDTDQI